MPTRIPNYKSVCISTAEAEIIYECLEKDEVVSPLKFCKRIYPDPEEEVRPEYKVLHEINLEFGVVNPYEYAIFHLHEEDEKDESDIYLRGIQNLTHMSDWSILSTEMHYPCHPRQKSTKLMVMDSPPHVLRKNDVQVTLASLQDLGLHESEVVENYLDLFEDVSHTLHVNYSIEDNRDITTTYLGIDKMKLTDIFKPELRFPIFPNSHVFGEIVGASPVNILLDTGASRCYMSKAYYMRTPMLHSLPKFESHIKSLLVGSGQYVMALFVIPIILQIKEHKFELYALVSDIQESIDLVIGMKNMFELEGELSCRHSEFRFFNRAIPLFPVENFTLNTGQKRFVKVTVPFLRPLSGIAIVKITLFNCVMTLQMRIENNMGVLDIVNTTQMPISFTREEALGIVDIRSLGYYNVKHSTLQYSLNNPKAANKVNMFQYYEDKYNQYVSDFASYDQMVTGVSTSKGMKESMKSNKKTTDPYPWLEPDDERRYMSDEEILRKFIDLSESNLNDSGKEELLQLIIKYKKAFSLRDEIGNCPNIEIDIDVIDDTPFFVRPFPISEEDKPIMDRQMKRLVSLGILSRNTTSHTSPVMLITRKVTKDKRPVVDFRLLNTRIRRQNTATPLMRDIYQMIGKSHSTVMSVFDAKDAFHSLALSKKSKDFCGIMPYYGSPHYRYEVMPMGLSISPCKWIEYITMVMEGIPHRESYLAIMDDILIHSKQKDHLARTEELLKAMIRHRLKLSPKKCQLFRDQLVYMGNLFILKPNKIMVTPIKKRTDAIQNTPAPRTAKECKSFCGVVNYLSLFCPHLQRHLAPIYDLTRKGRPFIWTDQHQQAFDTIKSLMSKPPVLFLPDGKGRYILCSDTSKTHAGSSLWQIQQAKPRLIGFASKKLPEACKNYSITELEMTGLLYNMKLWQWYLGKKNFDAIVDHRCIPYILQSKHPPTTNRIVRLLQELNRFDFHLYYVKGKDMILADYFSRVPADQDSAEELIPIAFEMNELKAVEYNTEYILHNIETAKESMLMMRRSQAKAQGVAMPSVHGAKKAVNPDLKPETQAKRQGIAQPTKKSVTFKLPSPQKPITPQRPVSPKKNVTPIKPVQKESVPSPITPAFSTPMQPPLKSSTPFFTPEGTTPQGRDIPESPISLSPVKRKLFEPKIVPTQPPQEEKQEEEEEPDKGSSVSTRTKPILPDVPFSLPKTPVRKIADIQPTPEQDPETDVPIHDISVEAMFRPPQLADFVLPPTLSEVNKGKTLVAKRMPKQSEIDRLMKHINKKILRDTRYPESLKDLEAAYTSSAAFRDIYIYLRYNRLPTTKQAAKRIEHLSQDYYVLGKLLFRRIMHKSSPDPIPVLCIPPSRFDNILDYYHDTMVGGHQGMTKTLKTLSEKFFTPRMAEHIRAYIIGCHVCQLYKNSKRFSRPFHHRKFDISIPTLTHISMDIKHMIDGFLLLFICEISNFLIVAPMHKIQTATVCDILFDEFISIFGSPVRIQCDQDPVFMASLAQYMFQQFGIKIVVCSPTNHKSLYAEHGIKSLSNLLVKHMSGLGTQWKYFCKPCQLMYNTAVSPNLADLSPFELVFGRKAKICPELEILPSIPVTGTFSDAKANLIRKLKYLRTHLLQFREKRFQMLNKDKQFHGYTAGQIVYLFFPGNSQLNVGSKKLICHYVGPLAIWKCLSPTQFILMSLDGVIYPFLVEETRIKPGHIRSSGGPISTMAQLRKLIKEGYVLNHDSPVMTSITEDPTPPWIFVQSPTQLLCYSGLGDMVPYSQIVTH